MAEEERYILVKLSEAKQMAHLYRTHISDNVMSLGHHVRFVHERRMQPVVPLLARFEKETGANMEEIAQQLKAQTFCPACVTEDQRDSCCSLHANKLGRRLSRLIDRANGITPTEENNDNKSL